LEGKEKSGVRDLVGEKFSNFRGKGANTEDAVKEVSWRGKDRERPHHREKVQNTKGIGKKEHVRQWRGRGLVTGAER